MKIQAGLTSKSANKCPFCGKKAPHYDRTSNTRLWRTLDFHNVITYIEGPAYRVNCPEHGVVTVAVPWAAPNARFTYAFDREVAWLARENTRSMVSEYPNIDWESVGSCISRVMNDIEPDPSCRFKNLRYIGIDETSRKKGHNYITVVVNHEKNEVVWVGEGKGEAVLSTFFELLTEEERLSIEVVTADGADWITACVNKFCPNATRCMDAFHTVEWINEAMDDIRKETWNQACSELRTIKKEASAEAKRQALAKIRQEYDEEIRVLEADLCAARSEEEELSERKAHLKTQKKALKEEIAALKAEASSALMAARSQFEEALRFPRELFAFLAMAAITLLYEYYEINQKLEEAQAAMSAVIQELGSIGPRIPELVGKRRNLRDKIKKARAAKKKALEAANKKAYTLPDADTSNDGTRAQDITDTIHEAEQKAKILKRSKYAFLKNPENLFENQISKLELLANSCPDLYRAYQMKESLRITLRSKDADFVSAELEEWIYNVRESGIPRLCELASKIERHKEHIINTVKVGMSNARIEATNTKIKLIIRKAYGFRNIENLKAMVRLVCSDLDIPRCHRPEQGARKIKKQRESAGKAA